MIEDKELRDLFQAESEEHVRLIEDGLLQLEKQPDNPEVVEEVLREAHSMKGAARMLGLSDIELLAHTLEDNLRLLSKGEIACDANCMDALLQAVDQLKLLSLQVIEGEEEQSGTLFQVLEQLRAVQSGSNPPDSDEREHKRIEPEPVSAPQEASSAAEEPEVVEEVVEKAVEEQPTEEVVIETHPATGSSTQGHHIETIRVAPKKLDSLMVHAGELMVTRSRVVQRQTDIATLTEQLGVYLENYHQLRRHLDEFEDSSHKRRLDELYRHGDEQLQQLVQVGNSLNADLTEDSARLDMVSNRLEEKIREVRMLPLSTLFDSFNRMVRDISHTEGKQVDLVIEGGDTLADKRVVEEMKDPLMHLIRNAISHGIESSALRQQRGKRERGTIFLRGRLVASQVEIEVADDGQGLDLDKLEQKALSEGLFSAEELGEMDLRQKQNLIFISGLTTEKIITDISGRGIGMDVVRNNVESLKGKVNIDSEAEQGCRITCQLPQTYATTRVILLRCAGQLFGVPVEFVEASIRFSPEEIYTVEGRMTMTYHDQPLSLAASEDLLELTVHASDESDGDNHSAEESITCMILNSHEERIGLLVEEVVDEQELVLKPPGALLKRVRNVSGAGILGTGKVCMVLNPLDLIRSVQKGRYGKAQRIEKQQEAPRKRILLAEDSTITRTLEKRILEGAGYEVDIAVDGADAWEQLQRQSVDAVVSDILMPRMDGFELTATIREDDTYELIPIILVTTLSSDEDRRRGLDAGANAYISKAAFEENVLLETLQRLIG